MKCQGLVFLFCLGPRAIGGFSCLVFRKCIHSTANHSDTILYLAEQGTALITRSLSVKHRCLQDCAYAGACAQPKSVLHRRTEVVARDSTVDGSATLALLGQICVDPFPQTQCQAITSEKKMPLHTKQAQNSSPPHVPTSANWSAARTAYYLDLPRSFEHTYVTLLPRLPISR